jgi:CHASE2 domain-containing sensor protein
VKRLREWALRLLARLRRVAALLIIAFAIHFFIEAANPFGMVDTVKGQAAETLQLVAGSFSRETPGQRAVTVVLIDEHYFETVQPQGSRPVWPMPVNQLMMSVIRRVLEAEPKALFVDIAFPDAPREIVDGGRNTRAEALQSLSEHLAGLDQGTPIFLGDDLVPGAQLDGQREACGVDFLPSPSVQANRALAAPLVAHLFQKRSSQNVEVVDASWPGSSTLYQLAPILTGAGGNCRTLQRQHAGYVASPALALFAAYTQGCPRTDSPGCDRKEVARLAHAIRVNQRSPVDANGLRTYTLGEPARGGVALHWRVALSEKMTKAFATSKGSDACVDQFYRPWWYGPANYLIHFLGPIRHRLGEPTGRRCVYIDTISAGDLADSRQYQSPAAGSGPQPDTVESFLRDRIVLLGVDLPQSSDRFHSPVNGDVPGVYMHAAAIENLITFGEDYPAAETGWAPWLAAILVAVLIGFAMAALWQWLCERLNRWFGGWGQHLLAPLLYVMAMLVVGPTLILLLSAIGFPLPEIAMPLIVLNVILFAGMVKNWEEGLRKVLGVDPA